MAKKDTNIVKEEVTNEVKEEEVITEVEEEEATTEVEEVEEKLVRIKIPKVRGDDADVFVSVNERTFLIKRGEFVDVPECVKEVLDHQEEMLDKIYDFEEANASDV